MADLERSEVLCVPKRRRLVHSREKGEAGQDVLHVFYGAVELIFDEPELLPFGHKLLEVDRFPAEEAMSWSDGAPHTWEKTKELLEALLEQEILKRVADAAAAPPARTFPATLGTPPDDPEPRTFSAREPGRCPMITQKAFGRPFELGNLEAIIPVYRVAHPAMDRDGRQVGENNVQPRHLFLDLPTQRRACNYAGNRYQADTPMNVTALKHMTERWPELLSLTEQSRVALLGRVPPRGASLTAGEAHLLTVSTLASVGYVMVRGVDPVPNGELDAGLAAMFRLIDGVRLVTTALTRETAGEHGCERPVTAQSIADYAERHAVYHGLHGVCAGPQALIEEYLRVLIDGGPAPIRVTPDLAARVGDLDAALDYGLIGQRVEAAIRVFGGMQGLRNERLRAVFASHPEPRTKLHALFERPVDPEHYSLLRDEHPLNETLELEIAVSRWLFERSGDGLPRGMGGAIDEALTLDPAAQAASRQALGELFTRAPEFASAPSSLRDALVEVTVETLALERRCLRVVGREQQRLNERLRRPAASPLTGDDLAIYTKPRNGPPLEATLTEGLGIAIVTNATSTVVSHGDHRVSLTD